MSKVLVDARLGERDVLLRVGFIIIHTVVSGGEVITSSILGLLRHHLAKAALGPMSRSWVGNGRELGRATLRSVPTLIRLLPQDGGPSGGLLESVSLLESCRYGKGNAMAVKKKPTAKKKPVARNKPEFSRVQSGYRQGREERQRREEQEKKR
jgi:hypothetical protein